MQAAPTKCERERRRRRPALPRPDRQRVEQDRHARRRQHESGEVEPAGILLPRLLQPDDRQGHRDDAHRHVDQEDPAPRRLVDEQPAEHRADRRRDHRHAEHADRRLGPLGHRERSVQHRRPDRGDEPAARALQDAEEHELIERLRQPAEQRHGDEDRQRDDEHPLGAEAVAEPTGGRDHRGEAQQVADRDPLDVGGRHAEVACQRRQGDVDHRAVDDAHHQAEDVDRHHPVAIRHRPNLRESTRVTPSRCCEAGRS